MVANPDCCDTDVLIVGGGLVGASLAAALLPGKLRITLVEAVEFNSPNQISFDARTIALTDNARLIFSALDLWEKIAPSAVPINDIHISARGQFGMTHLRASDIGRPALGYVVGSRRLGEVLYGRIANSDVQIISPATVLNVEKKDNGNIVTVDFPTDDNAKTKSPQTIKINSKLVVVAAGSSADKLTTNFSPTQTTNYTYPHSAILSIVQTDKPHNYRAFERFTEHGPIALLPYKLPSNNSNHNSIQYASQNCYAAVWTTPSSEVENRLALTDAEFCAQLQHWFGNRAGRFSRPSPRQSYPLYRTRLKNPVIRRSVTIGNAAHTVHPVAGQGFNLGLRDVAVLAELIYQAAQRGEDVASPTLLNEYANKRRMETKMVGIFTDGLINLFTTQFPAVKLLRNLGLVGVELCTPIKRLLLRRTVGLASSSQLGRGLPLAADGDK